ncbi:fasciclin domain-containing protein [Roseateles sp. BYS78W]|uniref:Fasciclin domain-containing protein n=1 Tax=Pelomonas candidula TaxID=3299025 RepID=A0ABW7HH59_9BURK
MSHLAPGVPAAHCPHLFGDLSDPSPGLPRLCSRLAAGRLRHHARARTAGANAARDPQFTPFNRLAAQSGLAEELRGAGPLTVFVPSDDAFKAMPAKTKAARGRPFSTASHSR